MLQQSGYDLNKQNINHKTNSDMTAKKQVITMLFAAFLIMLYLSMKATTRSSTSNKLANSAHINRI